jgi:glycosyltransferase involved in cell wall biosynthesis
MSAPFFSVVIPLYNKSKYIARTINSVLSQTFKNFEVIVVDDGSTDDSRSIVESFPDARVQILHQENLGVSAARNRGIAAAKGVCVAFLDADDEWLPMFLEVVYEAYLQKPDAEIIYTAYSTSLERIEPSSSCEVIEIDDYFASALNGQSMCASAVTIRRCVLEISTCFPLGVGRGEDLDLWFRLIWSGKKVYFINKVLSLYHRDASESTLLNFQRENKYHDWYFWNTYSTWLAGGRVPHSLQESSAKYMNKLVLSTVMELVFSNCYQDARIALRKKVSIFTNPKGYFRAFIACYLPRNMYLLLREMKYLKCGLTEPRLYI